MRHVLIDRREPLGHAGEHTAAQTFGRYAAKEALTTINNEAAIGVKFV